MGQGSQIKRVVVLLNLGGPTSMAEVGPFLFSLFYDKAIINFPNPFRWALAKLISSRRLQEASHIYESLGGKSPLYEETLKQRDALSQLLDPETQVFVAMRHAFPRTEVVFEEVRKLNPQEVILLPLYPQYSTTTTGSALEMWRALEEKFNWHPQTRAVCCYPTLSGFIDPIVSKIQEIYAEAERHGKPYLILSAHGLPEKVIKAGDPYQMQVEKTAQAIVEKLNISDLDWIVSYQSRVGPLPWIKPYTEEVLKAAARAKKPIIMVPIAFVSEHSETLYELDQMYGQLAETEGAPGYYRVPTVSTDSSFIQGLYDLMSGNTPIFSCPQTFQKCGQKECPPFCKRS
ncbi:Ferrochelatase [Candidatus Bealeia paramacronuclearis]|uniref:Ferrochelatase n=1 Tax=Candidatus Bealeia paramacronuclearis TaxID=1921001 RepID=A0ABZ2C1J0_9PROT|nr:Ferrochelatase [Candidatus Bealeia paramacronuclearis]